MYGGVVFGRGATLADGATPGSWGTHSLTRSLADSDPHPSETCTAKAQQSYIRFSAATVVGIDLLTY